MQRSRSRRAAHARVSLAPLARALEVTATPVVIAHAVRRDRRARFPYLRMSVDGAVYVSEGRLRALHRKLAGGALYDTRRFAPVPCDRWWEAPSSW
jgi:hypothetical protein